MNHHVTETAAGTHPGLPASLDQVLILANPTAGTGPARDVVDQLQAELAARGLRATVSWERQEWSARLETCRGGLRCVVAAGGDGTFAEALNRVAGVPLTLLPLGNENLAARHFGLGRSARTLAEAIVAGRLQALDLARANGRLFSLMAGAGFDADVVHRLHRRRRGHVNKLHYVGPIVRSACSYPYPPIDIEIEDTGERLQGAMAFVFNLPRYALGLPIAPAARGDDGWLDLRLGQRPGRWNLLRYLAAAVRGRLERLADFQGRRVRRLKLTAAEPVPLQIDGDPAGTLPVTIDIVPAAVQVVVPPFAPGGPPGPRGKARAAE
jgi:diacylglycerol kinase family enzyme